MLNIIELGWSSYIVVYCLAFSGCGLLFYIKVDEVEI